jgi:rod shape-determining protein MreD
MILRLTLLVACLLAAALVDSAWVSRLPLPAGPDLLLLIALGVGIRRGLEPGALAGAAAGYLRDLVGGGPLGLFALSYLGVGALAGAASVVVDQQQRALPAMAAAVGTVALGLANAALVTLTGAARVAWGGLAAEMAVGALLNAVLAGWVDRLVRRIDRLAQRRYAGRTIGHRIIR